MSVCKSGSNPYGLYCIRSVINKLRNHGKLLVLEGVGGVKRVVKA